MLTRAIGPGVSGVVTLVLKEFGIVILGGAWLASRPPYAPLNRELA